MPTNKISEGRITNCAACGWRDESGYDAECDCLDCNAMSAAHLARHNGVPARKPMVRIIEARTQSTLINGLARRAG